MPITATGKYASGHIVSDGSWVVGHEDSTGDWILREALSESATCLLGVAMDNEKLYESYATGTDTTAAAYGAAWRAQTFTPSQSHTVSRVSMKLFRIGSPGTVTVSIRATSADLPTGSDIGSGTSDGDSMTLDSGGEWYDFTLSAPVVSGTKYAIVVRAPSGDINNRISFKGVNIGAYGSGTDAQSADSGGTWSILTACDHLFREYGETGTDRAIAVTRDSIPKLGVFIPWWQQFPYTFPFHWPGGTRRQLTLTRDPIPKVGIKPVFGKGGTRTRSTLSKLGVSLGGYLYEYWNTGADSSGSAYGANIWIAQTFTPSTNHNIWSVRLRLCRTGSPGTVTVELYATSGGKPTTSLSCSGSTNGNTLTTDWAGEWRAINMTSSYSLVSGTQYALVVKAATGDATNYVRWSLDAAGGLANGTYVQSNDGGGTWTIFNAVDSIFEIYSTPISGTARVFVGTRDMLSKAGVKSLTDRAIALVRDPIPKVGIKPVFDKGVALVRDTLSKMGVKPVFDRTANPVRDAIAKLGAKAITDRAITVTRDSIPGSTVYTSFTTAGNYTNNAYGAVWKAQTFTPSSSHFITSVRLCLYRAGSPGTVTVSIRDTDAEGKPTDGDLCSGTMNGNTLSAVYNSSVYTEFIFTTNPPLTAGTKYAIVLRCAGINSSNAVLLKSRTIDPRYSGGAFHTSTNSGSTWSAAGTDDTPFYEYGYALSPIKLGIKMVVDKASTIVRDTLSKTGIKTIADRTLALVRDIISKTGIKNIPDRALGLVRDTIPKTGVKMVVDRGIALVRDAIPKQGVKMTVDRAVTVVRDTVSKMGVKPVFDRTVTIVRDTIIKIGVYLDSLEIPYQTATVKAHARAFTTKLHDHTHTVAMHARSLANKLRTRT